MLSSPLVQQCLRAGGKFKAEMVVCWIRTVGGLVTVVLNGAISACRWCSVRGNVGGWSHPLR